MIYPSNFEQKISFDSIRQLLKDNCISSLGKSRVDNIRFSDNFHLIDILQSQTEEFRQILLFDSPFPAQDYYDLREEWKRIEKEGSFIELEKLCEFRACMRTISLAMKYFLSRSENNKYPQLTALTQKLAFNNDIFFEIDQLVDEKGNIKDSASDLLFSIRRQIKTLEADISKNIRNILNQAKQSKVIDDNAEITVRNGRLVIPIPAVNKRKIKGFTHDQSASGQTYFIEPQEIFESNNLLHNLQIEEQREIIQILTRFTDRLRPDLAGYLECFNYLSLLDFIRAKAKFAIEFDCCKPILVKSPTVNWRMARHPLLQMNLKRQGKEIVPLTIAMGEKHRILIISGPNAGGKSVCLKTLALLQYMFQCGLPVSASPISEFGIFKKLFINIGDEQSIDNDLSTYSSQLQNIKVLLANADKNSLFMFDELGGGTDPQYGGAIAETLIEKMADKQAIGLITTHFGNLKTMAETHEGIENGAMIYDDKEMHPTFQLKIGQFGTSFTIEIAKQIGIDKQFLNRAKTKVGQSQIRYDHLIRKVEQQQADLEKQAKEMAHTDEELKGLIAKYNQLNNELKQKQYEILHKAKTEAKSLLDSSNKLIEKTVREIKESQADKNVVKQQREEIKKLAREIDHIQLEEPAKPDKQQKKETIKLHDFVIMEDTQIVGEVIGIDNEDIFITFDSVQVKTTIDKVTKVSRNQAKKILKKSINTNNIISEKSMHFNLQLDIRGYRADEAIIEVEHYIDDALLLSTKEISILHGKGNGILRQVIREYLATHPCVKKFRDEHVEHGGTGITVVELI